MKGPPPRKPEAPAGGLAALPDNDLLIQLKSAGIDQQTDLFGELVRRYKDRIVHFLYRYVGDRSTAEDLGQEAFIRVFRNILEFDPASKFSTWLYTIATNLAKDEFKRRARHPAKSLDWKSTEASDTTRDLPGAQADERIEPDIYLQRRELRDQINQALSRLKDEDREVLVLREIQHMAYEDISMILNVPIGTVKSRISRARSAFTAVWLELSRGNDP